MILLNPNELRREDGELGRREGGVGGRRQVKISSDLNTGELGYDGLNGTIKIGPSYAKSVIYL